MKILDEQCATCIFRPGNPMQLQTGRVAAMVRECRVRQSFIPCHETMTIADEDEHADRTNDPVCRGFYDAHGEVSQLIRISERLGMIEFVPQTNNNLEDA